MTDKVLCPWCGSEMTVEARWHWSHTDDGEREWNAWTQCNNDDCGSNGPYVLDRPTEEEAINDALKRGLRRYEPPVRPLTLEEFKECAVGRPALVEDKDQSVNNAWVFPNQVDCLLEYIGHRYGKTWRCWPRKPTEQEREAYRWENAE